MTETFLLHDFRMFVPVQIGQLSGYANLDTGARHSSILQSYAESFARVGEREIRTAFATAFVPQVRLERLQCLGETFPGLTVDILPNEAGDVAALPFPVIATLGSDVLLTFPLMVDFLANTVGFLKTAPPDEATFVRLPADFHFGPPSFAMHLADQPVQAVWDTGAAMSVLHQKAIARFQDALAEDEPLEAQDPTGSSQQVPTYRCRDLRLGDTRLDPVCFLAIDLSPIEQQTGRPVDIVFGINAMSGRCWIVDRPHAQILLR